MHRVVAWLLGVGLAAGCEPDYAATSFLCDSAHACPGEQVCCLAEGGGSRCAASCGSCNTRADCHGGFCCFDAAGTLDTAHTCAASPGMSCPDSGYACGSDGDCPMALMKCTHPVPGVGVCSTAAAR